MAHSSKPPATEKKSRWTRKCIGLIAVLALAGIAAALTPIQTKTATFLIDLIVSWGAGETLTAGKNALLNANGGLNKSVNATLSPIAKAVVNTAYWLSNSYNDTQGGGMEQRHMAMDGKLDNHNRQRQPTAAR